MLALGAVMVYSASSAESLLDGSGDPSTYLKRYVLFGVVGLGAMLLAARRGLALVRRLTPLLLGASFLLTVAVMLPGVGVTVNGATRWLGAGPLQFQPSELLKVSLVLYAAQVLATRPRSVETLEGIAKPLLIVVGAAFALLMKQPDMGTTMVICFAIGCLLIVAGTPIRLIGTLACALAGLALLLAVVEPYRMARLTAFLNPFADAGDTGFQAVQGLTAIGSGGLFGVGLGESVQKIFYLPEAHTDMILAIIGEELGLVGIAGVAGLYAMIGYAGLRTAKAARDRYSKLLAAGITSLILCQATLNFFAVLGLAPLTGVPLPFISYGSTNLIVLLAGMGLLLNVAATGGLPARAARPRRTALPGAHGSPSPRLRAIDGGGAGEGGDRRRRDGGTRRAGAGRRRRTAG
jgi:cell division protein FtsW